MALKCYILRFMLLLCFASEISSWKWCDEWAIAGRTVWNLNLTDSSKYFLKFLIENFPHFVLSSTFGRPISRIGLYRNRLNNYIYETVLHVINSSQVIQRLHLRKRFYGTWYLDPICGKVSVWVQLRIFVLSFGTCTQVEQKDPFWSSYENFLL